jgi:hypothetical protein
MPMMLLERAPSLTQAAQQRTMAMSRVVMAARTHKQQTMSDSSLIFFFFFFFFRRVQGTMTQADWIPRLQRLLQFLNKLLVFFFADHRREKRS